MATLKRKVHDYELKTERRRKFKFDEIAFLEFPNILVNCEKFDLNALLRNFSEKLPLSLAAWSEDQKIPRLPPAKGN